MRHVNESCARKILIESRRGEIYLETEMSLHKTGDRSEIS